MPIRIFAIEAIEHLRLIQEEAVLALEAMSPREIRRLEPGILEVVERLLTIDISSRWG